MKIHIGFSSVRVNSPLNIMGHLHTQNLVGHSDRRESPPNMTCAVIIEVNFG